MSDLYVISNSQRDFLKWLLATNKFHDTQSAIKPLAEKLVKQHGVRNVTKGERIALNLFREKYMHEYLELISIKKDISRKVNEDMKAWYAEEQDKLDVEQREIAQAIYVQQKEAEQQKIRQDEMIQKFDALRKIEKERIHAEQLEHLKKKIEWNADWNKIFKNK